MLEVIGITDEFVKYTQVVSLTYDQRRKGRLKTFCDSGMSLGLFLERGKLLVDGDFLITKTGEIIKVISRPEPLVSASSKSFITISKICYHLGNRHVPLEIKKDHVFFQPDHVLEDLCRDWGLKVESISRPFNPEFGAYGRNVTHHV